MKIKKKPDEIFSEYEDGKQWNQNHDLYENVEKNQRFYLGDQWYGVNAPNLVKPVFNVIKRVISYFVATIVSNDIGVHITPLDDTEENKAYASILENEIDSVLERTSMNAKSRTSVKNCCVDGDTDMFITFDPEIETNKNYYGDIDLEIVDNTHVIFGNPYSMDVQRQPYILVVQRVFTSQVKDMSGTPDEVTSDDDSLAEFDDQSSDKLTTVITKFWKEKTVGTEKDQFGMDKPVSHTDVWYTKVTAHSVIKEPTKLGYHLYPVSHMTWERVKNSYHGRSPITGLIPNQIFINKIYAMCMVYMTNMGFPRVFYDENKLAKLTNDVSKATAVSNMDIAGKVIDAVKAPDFSNQVIQLIDSTITYTKELMGASDSALGELTNPNNTSAIVAVQQASSVPLEIQKLDFHQFYEDIVRIIVDIMATDYGTRKVKLTSEQAKAIGYQPSAGPNGEEVYPTSTDLDFSILHNMNYELSVEIGQSSYWSEASQVQTMDNLFDKGIITNPVTYLEGIPDKYIPNKQKLIDEVKQQQAEQQRLAQMQANGQGEEQPYDPNVTAGMQDGLDNRASTSNVSNEDLQNTYQQSKEFYQ